MRRSLIALIVVLAALFATNAATEAAPRTSTALANKIASYQLRSLAASAKLSQAKRLARSKKSTLYVVQARNPHWTKSNRQTLGQAVTLSAALKHQGVSAHVHNLGDAGAYVHYGMVQWQSKGALTNRTAAKQAAAKFEAAGLQARVVTHRFGS